MTNTSSVALIILAIIGFLFGLNGALGTMLIAIEIAQRGDAAIYWKGFFALLTFGMVAGGAAVTAVAAFSQRSK